MQGYEVGGDISFFSVVSQSLIPDPDLKKKTLLSRIS